LGKGNEAVRKKRRQARGIKAEEKEEEKRRDFGA
jgi:hypothetical protein